MTEDLKGQRWPKSARLRKSRDFRFGKYRRLGTPLLVFYYSTQGKGRLGISVSKKVSKRATTRNRIRRMIREAFRVLRGRFQGVDVHAVAAPGTVNTWTTLKTAQVTDEFLKLVRELKGSEHTKTAILDGDSGT